MASLFPSGYYSHNLFNEYNIDVDELNENSCREDPVPNFQINLKPHQSALLKRCIEFENGGIYLKHIPSLATIATDDDIMNTKIGIIGDRVGSGKSFVILALIKSNQLSLKDEKLIKTCGMNNIIIMLNEKRKKSVSTNLLVIPHNISTQWENYIFRADPDMKYLMVNKQKTMSKLLSDEDNVTSYDVVIVTSTFYNRFATYVEGRQLCFQRIIYDEVDSLHINAMKSIDSKFHWLVTASYGNLLYPRGFNKWDSRIQRYIWCAEGIQHSGFIKSLLMDITGNMPHSLMRVLVVKNSESFVESSLNLPDMQKHYILCKTPKTIHILHGIVEKSIIQCLNANDIQGALAYINPTHKSTEENIVGMLIDKYERQVSNYDVKIEMTKQLQYDDVQEQQNEIQKLEKKKDEVSQKMNMVKERIQNSNTCCICYDDIENKTITPCCQNAFCFKCLNLWLGKNTVCPMCKHKLDSQDIFVVDNQQQLINVVEEDEPIPDNKMHEKYDKYKNMEILLKNRTTESKYLMFSNHDNSFTSIIPILNSLSIKYDQLKGNTNQINSVINKYKQGNVDCLMVNTRYYGSGLNLENTTDVIMFHKFDNEIEKQVIGRAHRMGRTQPLNVWYFLHENEFVQ